MNRIDGPNAVYDLSRKLSQQTGGKVSTFTIGAVHDIDGGRQRQMTARVDGVRRSFIATETGGQVSLREGMGADPRMDKIHEMLGRLDKARELAKQKSVTPKKETLPQWPNRQAANQTNQARALARRR